MGDGFMVGRAAESGNGQILRATRRRGRRHVQFMSEPRASPEPLWFHVSAEGAGGELVRFEWMNADGCLGLGGRRELAGVRPVVRVDRGDWARADSVTVRARPGGGHSLSFATPGPCGRADAAFCYPYGPADLEQTLSQLGGAWAVDKIGLTGSGRPIPRLRTRGDGRKPGVYLVARQHAGETPGSWVLDGILRVVAGARQRDILRKVAWRAVPFVDLDGVVEGDYGKDAMPYDFNRAWLAAPMRPEVLCVQADVRSPARRAAMRLLLDLHAPGGGEHAFYIHVARDERSPEERTAGLSFGRCLARHFAELPAESLVRVPRYASRWPDAGTASSWAWDHMDGLLGVGVETSYQCVEEGAWLTPDGYREIGARLARAAAEWVAGRV
jgi:hypothetical protein